MKEELTQAELDRIFYGKPPVVEARFYNSLILDVPASRAAGERIEKTIPFIHLKCVKEGVETTRPATKLDQRDHAQAWQAFQKEEQAHELPGQVSDIRKDDCNPYRPDHFKVETG